MNSARKPWTGAGAGKQLAFDYPAIIPKWPNIGTLDAAALRLFLAGETLTHPEFESITQSWRLAAVVRSLRLAGWPVVTDEISAPTADRPDRVIARYRLEQEFIAAAADLMGGGAYGG